MQNDPNLIGTLMDTMVTKILKLEREKSKIFDDFKTFKPKNNFAT